MPRSSPSSWLPSCAVRSHRHERLGSHRQAEAAVRSESVSGQSRQALSAWPEVATSPVGRAGQNQAEAQIKQDPAGWRRYQNLRQELWAWNAVESGVAAGFAAALVAL